MDGSEQSADDPPQRPRVFSRPTTGLVCRSDGDDVDEVFKS